jgi:predicted Zn-dependent protease
VTSCGTVRALSLALVVAALAGSLGVPNVWAQAPAAPGASASETLRTDTQRIARLFYAGQHEAVVRAAGPILARHGVTPTSLPIALLEAESQLQLGRRDEAVRGYERTLPVIATLNNVQQREFAFVFFRLALLARDKRQLDQALAKTEVGLQLEPQNTWGQILLGELFNERGDRARAVRHFKDVAAASFPTNEERAVLAIKIDRLTTGKVGSSVRPPDVRGARVHEGLSIGLVPLQDLPKDVVLADVCVALEVAWRIHCEVLPSIAIPDADVFVVDRGQYDAERLVNELGRRAAATLRPGRYLVAVAGRDLFGPKTNYVFSWQTRGGESGIGVISAYRFAAALDEFYEKGAVLMRRVTIQAISTSGSMLGFPRPTNPECPTAFPIDFREFQQKRARLCGSDEEQRDTLLRTRGGAAKAFSDAQRREIDRVYRAYYLQ